MSKKRVLILITDYGYGHRSCAKAIAQALSETYGEKCEVEIINPLKDRRAPKFLRDDLTIYDKLVQEMPDLLELVYQVGDNPVGSKLIAGTMTVAMFKVLRGIVRERHPQVIVCPYPVYPAILPKIFLLEKRKIPVVTVVTDLANVSRLWFAPQTDLCLVPTKMVYKLAVEAGLDTEKVKITGIPVNPDLGKAKREGEEKFTVLAIGNKRVEHMYEALMGLNHSQLPIRVVVAAGGDDELYKRLLEVKWEIPAEVHNFVENMPELMRQADCVLGKAGGLTVTESLAAGLPLILIDVIAGQEEGNADFVVAGGAGNLVKEASETGKVLESWLICDRELYKKRVKCARRLGKPRAAYEAAKLIWEIAG